MSKYTVVIGSILINRHGVKAAMAAVAQRFVDMQVADGVSPEVANKRSGDAQRRGGYFGNLLVFDLPREVKT